MTWLMILEIQASLTSNFNMILFNILNSLPHDKIPDWSKLKAFADDKLDLIKIIKSLFDRLKNTVGEKKRRKCWLPTCSPFTTVVFQSLFSWGR